MQPTKTQIQIMEILIQKGFKKNELQAAMSLVQSNNMEDRILKYLQENPDITTDEIIDELTRKDKQ